MCPSGPLWGSAENLFPGGKTETVMSLSPSFFNSVAGGYDTIEINIYLPTHFPRFRSRTLHHCFSNNTTKRFSISNSFCFLRKKGSEFKCSCRKKGLIFERSYKKRFRAMCMEIDQKFPTYFGLERISQNCSVHTLDLMAPKTLLM